VRSDSTEHSRGPYTKRNDFTILSQHTSHTLDMCPTSSDSSAQLRISPAHSSSYIAMSWNSNTHQKRNVLEAQQPGQACSSRRRTIVLVRLNCHVSSSSKVYANHTSVEGGCEIRERVLHVDTREHDVCMQVQSSSPDLKPSLTPCGRKLELGLEKVLSWTEFNM